MPTLISAVLALTGANDAHERKRIIEEQRDVLLTDDAEQLLNDWLVQAEGDHARTLQERLTLLARCRKESISGAFAERVRARPPREKVQQAILALVEANSARQREQLIQHQQDILLSDAADDFLAVWIENEEDFEDDDVIRNLRDCRTLLANCRDQGIEATFAHQTPPHSPPSAQPTAELSALLNEIERLTRRRDMPRRIELCRAALKLVERDTQPEEFAWLQNILGYSLNLNPLGDRADNLEQAINHLKQSLEVYTRQAYPYEWARSMNNLALAYSNRIRGERTENIEQAIDYFKQSQEVYTPQATPYEWARSINNLAGAYNNRIRGKRAENIERAISLYEQALEVRIRQAFPYDWALSCNNLAEAYRGRIRGERAENIERAIFLYEQSLEVRTRQTFPFEWAISCNNLALAYSDRIRGERAQNIERAISLYEQAQKVVTCQAFPFEWATSMNNLAGAYSDRIRGERAQNIEQAISLYEQALEVVTRQAFPFEWATTMNNLALALYNRIRGARAENIERAIDYLKQSLEVYTRQAFPFEWAGSCNNLALAYDNRIRGEPAENIERAIDYYEQALEVYTRKAFPYKWATSMNNLALAYEKRIRGEPAENIERVISLYEQSLEVYTPQSFPQRCRDVAYGLGRLFYDEGRFAEAREAFVTAHEAVEALRGEVVREGARRKLGEENVDLYARLVFCCLHGANADEEAAFEYAAAGKGRVFADLLASARFDLSAVGDDLAFAADWEKHRELRQLIDNLLVQLTGDRGGMRGMTMQGAGERSGKQESERVPSAILHEQLRATQKKAAAHWVDITFKYPALTACESAPPLSAQDARDLSAQLGCPSTSSGTATLVEYYQHAQGWCAFVVTPDEVRYVALPGVTDQLLEEMADWIEEIRYSSGRADWTIEMLDDWHEAVIAPLNLSALPSKGGRGAVVLSGFGALRRLPLFAARHPESKRYIAQEYKLAFVPSLGALRVSHQVRGSKAQSALKQLLSVAYPGTPPLANVIPEAYAVTKCFPNASSLHLDAATPNAVLEHAHDKQVIHLGCHGRFDSQHEQESGLMLAGGWLTVQRIIAEMALKECQLVTLGACESWVLTQAIMTAGASTVVSSQWVVNDIATRALFEAFYAHITNGYSPANALRQATQLIREQKGWAHPFYWAAFNVNGLAHDPLPKASQQSGCPLEGLGEQVETINRNSTRGEPPMDEKRIKREAQIYLKGIGKTYRKIGPTDGATVINRLTALSQQAATTQSESQLLALCDAIHKFVEEMPVLRQLLILEDSDVEQMQKERAVYLEDIEYAASQQQADKKALDTIRQRIVESRQKLERHLTKLEQQQNEHVPPRVGANLK